MYVVVANNLSNKQLYIMSVIFNVCVCLTLPPRDAKCTYLHLRWNNAL